MKRHSWIILMSVVACGSPPREAERPKPEAMAAAKPEPEPTESLPEPEPTTVAPNPSPPSDEPDYLITHRDCRALGEAYANSWRNDEVAALDEKNLEGAARDKARAELDADVGEVREQWVAQCEGTVGTPYPHANLACAMKARTVERFDACWAGQID